MAFTQKKITLVFTLGAPPNIGGNAQQKTSTASFEGSGGANRVTVEGLRVSCRIAKTAAPAMNSCELQIFGLLPTVYNALTSVYNVTQAVTPNTVAVLAGDDVSGMPTVFVGQITTAQINLNQPEAIMTITAQSAMYQALAPIPQKPYPGQFDVATAMKTLADAMNFNFESNGVNVTLAGWSPKGTARVQAMNLAEAAGIGLGFDDTTLVIFPKKGDRSGTQKTVEISAETEMIGYPSYGTNGIVLKTQYNPKIKWQAKVQVKSSLQVTSLNGLWTVFGLVHTLESEMPDGRWDTEIQGVNFQASSAT